MYSIYAMRWYPSYWTPLYIPQDNYYYGEGDQGKFEQEVNTDTIANKSSYQRNPAIKGDIPNPIVSTYADEGIDTSLVTRIGNRKPTPEENAELTEWFEHITSKLNEVRERNENDPHTKRGFVIVPDNDRKAFVWVSTARTSS
jgi:hypothetical protein